MAPNPLLAIESYSEFAEALRNSNCQKCGLGASRSKIVVDRGNYAAKMMVLGEAPGEKEDKQGKAFVGRAGQLFDRVMQSIGLDTNEDMLIANIAKCRPPGNRAPKKEEAMACLPYLIHQIHLVNPKIIVLLGATALRTLDPTKKKFSMAEESGKFFKLDPYPGCAFMVLYHPAALLYNSKLKVPMIEHARKLKEYLTLILR